MDEDPLQHRIYFLTFIESLEMIFSQYVEREALLCIPSLPFLSVPLRNPFKFFALVAVTKSRLHISAVSAVGCPSVMNFGLSLRTEFARFTRTLGSGFPR